MGGRAPAWPRHRRTGRREVPIKVPRRIQARRVPPVNASMIRSCPGETHDRSVIKSEPDADLRDGRAGESGGSATSAVPAGQRASNERAQSASRVPSGQTTPITGSPARSPARRPPGRRPSGEPCGKDARSGAGRSTRLRRAVVEVRAPQRPSVRRTRIEDDGGQRLGAGVSDHFLRRPRNGPGFAAPGGKRSQAR